MPIGSLIRTKSRVERAVQVYFLETKKELKIQKSEVFKKFVEDLQKFYENNKDKYPQNLMDRVKKSNITRFDRSIRQDLIPFLDDFFNLTTEKNFRYITNDDFIKIPYTDKDMKGLCEGVFKVIRHSTTNYNLETSPKNKKKKKGPKGNISIARMEIWKEPHPSNTECNIWRYSLKKITSAEINQGTSKELRAQGVIIKNYKQYMFVASEQYFPIDDEGKKITSDKSKIDTGTQVMLVTDDNDSSNLHGILLGATNFGHKPCATRVYMKLSPDMTYEDTGVVPNTDELSPYVDNDINPAWNMLLPTKDVS